MRRWVVTVLVITIGVFAFPGEASAHHESVRSYIERGMNVWGSDLNHCRYVYWGWAAAPPEVYGWAALGGCRFFLNRDNLAEFHSEPGLLCTVVIHEMGHLAGEDHSNDPENIMYGAHERGVVSNACL